MGSDLIEELSRCWDLDDGFFGKLRQGVFDDNLYQDFLSLLRTISFEEDDELIPRGIVTNLWYIPLFMGWQKERVSDKLPPESYEFKKTAIENELERIFGIP